MAAFSPLYGSTIAALLIAIWQSFRGLPYFASQPGHRLLVLMGLGISVVGLPGKCALLAESARLFPDWIRVPIQIACALLAISFLIAALITLPWIIAIVVGDIDEFPRWRRVYRLLAASITVPFCLTCGFDVSGDNILTLVILFASLILPVLTVAALVSAIAHDFLQRSSRDFWHWLGVSTFLAIPLHIFLMGIVEWL